MSTAPKQKVCPRCRTSTEAETNFCGTCGLDLRTVSPSVSWQGRAVTEGVSAQSGPIDPWIGRVIDARYRVLSRIGQGGMGIVYKVEHQRMGKIAAMKVLHKDLVADREVAKRFRREAEAVSRLTHPNTVQTFDFGTWDGAMYLVMEYVRGEDLGAILRRDGPARFSRVGPLFVQTCGALAEAHELGIVHRDLKPENILVTRTKDGHDHVKVLDFGLAKLADREELAEVTGRGTIVGTPYYMSPEQIRGEELDHRADIYALGALMYRILTGDHPFTAQTPVGVLTKHLTDPLVPPRERNPDADIPESVDSIIQRAMAKKREDRYATVDGLRVDLEAALKELAGEAPLPRRLRTDDSDRRASVSERALPLRREDFDRFEKSLRRRRVVRLFLMPFLLLAAVGAGLSFVRWRKEQPKGMEVEPNNDLESATPIAGGQPVVGLIGKRLSDNTSDRDYYRLDLRKEPGPRRLSVRVSSIRNIDLALAVYDRSGKLLAIGDNAGVGKPETIPNLVVNPGVLFVAVLESKEGASGRGPTENVTDQYSLTVDVALPGEAEEREPNEVDSDATPIRVGQSMTGFLGRLRDVDRFRFEGGPGVYDIIVEGGGNTSIRMKIGPEDGEVTRRRTAKLETGSIVILERDDEILESGRPVARDVDQPYTVTITPSK